MPKKLSNDIPNGYPVCCHSDCPQSSKCLHQVVYEEIMKRDTYIRLINPGNCTKDELCKFFRSAKPAIYARGFTKMQTQMYPDQYQKFMNILIRKFGRNPYYERRRGEYAMPPEEQSVVLEALHKAGVEKDLEFDRYEENINWNNE